MNRLLGSLAVAVAAALPMTGCGGSGGSAETPASEWANGFCSATEETPKSLLRW